MAYHKVNPLLAKACYLLVAKLAFNAQEFNKVNLKKDSYIFAPNHTNDYDGYLVWSLLSKDYDLNTFMDKEFWEKYPNYAKYLSIFNVNPITRDRLVTSELKNEITELKRDDHSLIIFPQGRNVNPEMIEAFPEHHLNTLPLGASYLALLSGTSIMPMYLETQERFKDNIVIYGTEIDPKVYGIVNSRDRKEVAIDIARKWVNQIVEMHKQAKEVVDRPLHNYRLREHYYDSYGKEINLCDPNALVEYLKIIKEMAEISKFAKNNDIELLGRLANAPKEVIDFIMDADNAYNNYLKRR